MRQKLASIASWWSAPVDQDVILKDYRKCSDDHSPISRGFPSLPSSDTLTDLYESLSTSNSSHYPLNYDAIKFSLQELNKFCDTKLPSLEWEWDGITEEIIRELFIKSTEFSINIGLLWATFFKKSQLLQVFIELGAHLGFYEHSYGLSALHLAAYTGCIQSTQFLLSQKECYVNLICKCYSPLHCAAFSNSPKIIQLFLDRGANIDAFTNDLHNHLESVLHCAVRSNAVESLQLLCHQGNWVQLVDFSNCRHLGANINQLDSSGRSPQHLASELGQHRCLEVLLNSKGVNIELQTKEKLETALHFAAHNCHHHCVEALLDHGASVDVTNFRNQTALHLAAESQSNECVKLLLKSRNSDPNRKDTYQRTPLHLVVAKTHQENSVDIIKTLIRYGADVNAKDHEGLTPLHLAATNELSECVETLILANADITAKCKSGLTALRIISRKTPFSIEAIRKKLDESITFSDSSHISKDIELQIDFSYILQHCHPKEAQFLKTLIEEGQTELLLHPVCYAFLYLKWNKIKKFFVVRAVCLLILVLTMSSYMLMGLARHCYNYSKNITLTTLEEDRELCYNHSFFSAEFVVNHPELIEAQWYLMFVMVLILSFRKLCAIHGYSSFSQYLFNVQNFLDWFSVLTVLLTSCVFTGRTYIWQNHVSAFGVLIAWANFLYVLGEFPVFGTYVLMYITVQREFAKLLLVFSCLLIGFTISFCILFPSSEVFSNIYIGFITVLVMAIGEMNLDLITNPSPEDSVFNLSGSTEIIYASFITCVTIILLNLLVGIAVHDIQGLKKTAKIAKVTKTTELIACIDNALFNDYFHKKIIKETLNWSTLVSSTGCCILKIKMNALDNKIIPNEVLKAAYEVGRKHRKKIKNHIKKSNKPVHNQLSSNSLKADIVKANISNLNKEIQNMKCDIENNRRLLEEILRIVKMGQE